MARRATSIRTFTRSRWRVACIPESSRLLTSGAPEASSRQRHHDLHTQAAAWAVSGANTAAVCLYTALSNGETEAVTVGLNNSGSTKEGSEKIGQFALRNPVTVVEDTKDVLLLLGI